MTSLKRKFADWLLSEGEHLGIAWCTASNQMGFRCGYVRLPKGHPWHGKHYDDIPAECHGDLSYSETFEDGHWIGFDCGHAGDAPDPKLPCRFPSALPGDVVRDQAYVEAECISLCAQVDVAR